jgi:hypothetical protein
MSHEKIEKLTPEQKALIPVYREKWRKIALSTEPIDKEKAAEAVKNAYEMIGEEEPKIIFCDSPYSVFSYWENIPIGGWETRMGEQIESGLGSGLKDRMWCDLWYESNLYIQVKSILQDQEYQELMSYLEMGINKILESQLETQFEYRDYYAAEPLVLPEDWTGLASLYEFCVSALSYQADIEKWKIYQQLVKHSGWIFTFEKICFVCDRPRILSFDNQYSLHAEGAPAIQFADGYSVYAYHGVALPEKYGTVHPNQWQPQWLLEEDNAELRRVLIQGIGYERIAQELGAIELDSYQEYTLLKIDNNVDIEPIYLLKMTCPSTGFIHALRVPPDVESARAAIRWVNWGIDPEEFAIQT